MSKFALICEGITDQIALESIIYGHYNDDDIAINSLQPLRDATDESRQGDFGGWEKVLEYCSDHEKIEEALHFNDFLIIQIDTDIIEHENFRISKLDNNNEEKEVSTLVADVRERIEATLQNTIVEKHRGRIIYAICVHSLECWLIPLHCNNRTSANKTKSCEKHLARFLSTSRTKYEKTAECYEILSEGFENKKRFNLALANESFRIFTNSLPTILPDAAE